MTSEVPAPTSPTPAPTAMPKRDSLVRRLLRDPVGLASILVILAIVAASLAAPLLTSSDPDAPSILNSLEGPAEGHPLGFDGVGRDLYARLLYGGFVSLFGALVAVTVALLIGVPAGLIAGYYRGRFDTLVGWAANIVMALPAIVVLLVVIASIGQSTNGAMLVFGILMSPGVFRLVRASVLAVREELYVDAARVSGLGASRIMRRHILPVVAAPTIIQAAQMFGIAIAIQAGLQFLGIGSTTASWGAMLQDAFANVYLAPGLLIWPTLALVVTVTAFAMLANAIRDAMGQAPARQTQASKKAAKAAAATHAERAEAAAELAEDGVEAEGDTLLDLDGLRVAYPGALGESVVVDDIALHVRRGDVLGLVGESGSGKTQTAFSILGLLPPTAAVSAGRIRFAGHDLHGMDQSKLNQLRGRRIAYVPQEPMSNLDPSFRVGDQLTEPIRHHLGLSKAEAKAKAIGLLERVGIPEPERTFAAYPHEVSGGMAQRVLIAGAVSCDPDLLIADEPTTALDVTVQAEVLDLLRSLQDELRMGIILVTHNFGVVADICTHVSVMQQGRIVESAEVEELFARPQHDYTKMLLGSTLEDSDLRAPLPAPAGDLSTSTFELQGAGA